MTSAALLALLRETQLCLSDGLWSSADRREDIRDCIRKLDAAIAEHETAPERKCGTCQMFAFRPDAQILPRCPNVKKFVTDDWFCADWQPRGGKDD